MKRNGISLQQWDNETRMKKLITAAMEKFDPEDLLELMYEKCCNSVQREYLKDKMIDLTTLEGGIFIKTKDIGLDKKDRLLSFVDSEIYPYHNEQAANVLFYS